MNMRENEEFLQKTFHNGKSLFSIFGGNLTPKRFSRCLFKTLFQLSHGLGIYGFKRRKKKKLGYASIFRTINWGFFNAKSIIIGSLRGKITGSRKKKIIIKRYFNEAILERNRWPKREKKIGFMRLWLMGWMDIRIFKIEERGCLFNYFEVLFWNNPFQTAVKIWWWKLTATSVSQ